MKSQKKNTCIWTKYVLQDTVCIYMMLYYIVYIYIYIYVIYIYLYMSISNFLMSNHDIMLDVIAHQQYTPCFLLIFWGVPALMNAAQASYHNKFSCTSKQKLWHPSVWAYVIGIQSQNKFRNWTWWNHPHWAQQINKRMSKKWMFCFPFAPLKPMIFFIKMRAPDVNVCWIIFKGVNHVYI